MKRHTVKVSIFRAGIITAGAKQATPSQCHAVGHNVYFYNCTIMATDPEFDSRGFLVDHNDVNDLVIRRCSEKIPSCETLAQTMAVCISDMLLELGVPHDYVHFCVSSVPIVENKGMNAWAYPNECPVKWIKEGIECGMIPDPRKKEQLISS